MPEDELTPDEALDEIREVQDQREPLARRTSGLTWMVLGLTLAAINMTYYLFFELVQDGILPESLYLGATLWIPWALAGVTMTRQLWRSAGLTMPGFEGRRGSMRALLLVGVAVLALGAGFLPWRAIPAPSVFVLAVGAASVVMGATGVASNDGFERRMWIGAGVVTVLITLVALALLPSTRHSSIPYDAFAGIAPGSLLLVYVGGGWLIARRG